jgi:hypothetical protein
MRPYQSGHFILVTVALAVAAGSLLVAGSARADLALFRVEQRWHNFPAPPVTTPGGAGMYQGYIQPYLTKTATGGAYLYPPGTAVVEPGNPIGGAFTLPSGIITFTGTLFISSPYYPGYTTISYLSYYNGRGKFGPNHGATGPTRVVFPTTMGNPYPTYIPTFQRWINGNYGDGDPVTPTTTFSGLYDMSRGGSITVTPGPRRFGGTLRLFHGPNAGWYQYIDNFRPAYYKAYGHYVCLDEGQFGCTPSTFASDVADTTATYQFTWYLLNVTGTGTGPGYSANTAKATTPTTANGKAPTPYGNASFLTGMRRYLNLIHPWTTGFAKVHNAKGSGWGATTPGAITPQAQGYDTSLGGADITVTHYRWTLGWNTTLSTLVTCTSTTKQYLYGVGRIVSMVRPRLIHLYSVTAEPSVPIANIWQAARLWRLKVFFLPEPAGMLLLAAGLGCLVVLYRVRR